jgi:protein-tyrosine phosphatase
MTSTLLGMKTYSVLFVCTGNICRSPTADGVLRKKVDASGLAACVTVDSAGTTDYHVGEPPDDRSQAHARRRGYDLSTLRARQVQSVDFDRFNLIVAMDDSHLHALQRQCPTGHKHKLMRFTAFCTKHTSHDVPDPYYGGAQGFEHVLDLVEDGCDGLLAFIQEQL